MKTVYGFDNSGGLPMMAMHGFEIIDGDLHHFIDGKLRAQVPPEGFESYAETWPDCKSVLVVASSIEIGDNTVTGSPASSGETPSPTV